MRMLIHIIIVLFAIATVLWAIKHFGPSEEQKGKKALIHNQDTCIILCHWPYRMMGNSPVYMVQYKTKEGNYLTEQFDEQFITIIDKEK